LSAGLTTVQVNMKALLCKESNLVFFTEVAIVKM